MLDSHSDSTALVFLILANVLWGTGFVIIKIGLSYVNTYDFVFLRLGLAAVLLFLLVLRRDSQIDTLKQREVWILGILNGAGFLLQNLGLSLTTAAKTALLTDMNVIIVGSVNSSVDESESGVSTGTEMMQIQRKWGPLSGKRVPFSDKRRGTAQLYWDMLKEECKSINPQLDVTLLSRCLAGSS